MIFILAIIGMVVFGYALKSNGSHKIPYVITVILSVVLAPYLTLLIIVIGAVWVIDS